MRLEQLIHLLPPQRKQRLEKIRNPQLREVEALATLWVYYTACQTLNMPLDKVRSQLLTEAGGKPYLACAPAFCFNLSHTKFAGVCAFDEGPVGVDIERVRGAEAGWTSETVTSDQVKRDKIARRFMHVNEVGLLRRSEHEVTTFYEIWTRKEAYVKYLGKGLAMPLASFDTTHPLGPSLQTLQLPQMPGESAAPYVVSICADKPFEAEHIQSLSTAFMLDTLYAFFEA